MNLDNAAALVMGMKCEPIISCEADEIPCQYHTFSPTTNPAHTERWMKHLISLPEIIHVEVWLDVKQGARVQRSDKQWFPKTASDWKVAIVNAGLRALGVEVE